MKQLQNVLYVVTEDSYLYRQGECICVKVGGNERVRVPAHTIESIVCFGNTTVSTPLIQFCGENGIGVTFFSGQGKFYGRVEGPVRGNVLLRTSQYSVAQKPEMVLKIASDFVIGKLANSRNILLRIARDCDCDSTAEEIRTAIKIMTNASRLLSRAKTVNEVRGAEGMGTSSYFSVYDHGIKVKKESFYFRVRSRRPPQDNMNALLSYLYMLLTNDMRSALEGVGLDPAVGYLHVLRPGRPSLALDMIEELRSPLCDRLALTLINLRQLSVEDFESSPDGVRISEKGRKAIINAWQSRKKEEISHLFLSEKVKIGLIPHLQARLFARYLRGELDRYPPFVWR